MNLPENHLLKVDPAKTVPDPAIIKAEYYGIVAGELCKLLVAPALIGVGTGSICVGLGVAWLQLVLLDRR